MGAIIGSVHRLCFACMTQELKLVITQTTNTIKKWHFDAKGAGFGTVLQHNFIFTVVT